MQILIGGDLVPTTVNMDLFTSGDVSSLIGDELYMIWEKADMRIFNLETPLTDESDPIRKCGPNLIAPKDTINGIKALKPSLLTLANNHILDQGEQGLRNTEIILNNNNIQYIGAGENISKASKPHIKDNNGIQIGFYACAEHEFTIATDKSSGANPFDPLESLDHIEQLKAKCDYVIVLYHGGKEHYRYPSPYLQKVCRKMVQKGADLVICQHSHCVGTFEHYEDSTIIYGQGNFIFNYRDNEFWNTSLLIKINISNKFSVDYIPIVRTDVGVTLATGQDAEDILNGFTKRSKEIMREGFIERRYQIFAEENIQSYLRTLSGYGKWLSRIDRRIFKGSLIKRMYNQKRLLAIQNYVECEAHRELMLQGIKGEIRSGR